MANMSISDLKHTLRKYEFPQCAKEALIRTGKLKEFWSILFTLFCSKVIKLSLFILCILEQLLVGRSAPSSKQLDIALEIISEFVFCESTRRGERRGLNPLQELQLIDVICDYLSSCTNETTKNTIFLSLFGGADTQKRLKILSILASMAVSASSTPVNKLLLLLLIRQAGGSN